MAEEKKLIRQQEQALGRQWVVLIDLNQLLTRLSLFFFHSFTVRRNLTPTVSLRNVVQPKSKKKSLLYNDEHSTYLIPGRGHKT